jgi:hypothetical protein
MLYLPNQFDAALLRAANAEVAEMKGKWKQKDEDDAKRASEAAHTGLIDREATQVATM